MKFASEEGVTLGEQTQIYILYQGATGTPEPLTVLETLTLDAGTQVQLKSDVQQAHPDQPALILREVTVLSGVNRGRDGWIDQNALENATPLTPHVIAENSSGVNVRQGDSTAYAIVGRLVSGESAKIIGVSSRGNSWYRIVLDNGEIGWVAPDVVQVVGNIRSVPMIAPPPSPTPSITPTPGEPILTESVTPTSTQRTP